MLQSPTSFAHTLWSHLVQIGSIAVDATCGNGRDTLYLAELILNEQSGKVYAFDIQEKAIENTKALLQSKLSEKTIQKIELICDSHCQIESYCQDQLDLIVFNLGYLPGADKSLTTLSTTTLISLKKSLDLLKNGGYLSIMCYPGHEEGAVESKKILEWAHSLNREYCVTKHTWINRSKKSPFLLLINKL